MSDMRSLALTRAYELVEAGKSDEARTVLEPILLNDRDNVDAWWIYAHAVDDPVEARRALDHVIRLDRDYPGAAELMVTLNQQYPEDAPEPVPVIADEPGIADLEPEFADDDSYVEEQRYTPVTVPAREERSINWLPIALLVALLAVLFIALVFILPNLNQGGIATPTSVAVLPDQITEPTVGIIVPPTEEATDMVVLPELTEVVLLDVTPVGGMTGEATDDAAIETTSGTSQPTDTAVADVEPGDSEATEMVETEPGDSDVTEATSTDASSIALGVTEASVQPEATPLGEAELPTEDVEITLEETNETSVPVIEAQPTEAADETLASPEAAEETDEPTAETEVTLEVEPEAVDVDYVERLETALQSFATAEPAVEELETEFGETLLVRVCTMEGLELRETLRSVMDLVANEVEALPEDLTVVGARLINCDMDRTLRVIVVDRESAAAYAENNLTDTQFEANWRAQ